MTAAAIVTTHQSATAVSVTPRPAGFSQPEVCRARKTNTGRRRRRETLKQRTCHHEQNTAEAEQDRSRAGEFRVEHRPVTWGGQLPQSAIRPRRTRRTR